MVTLILALILAAPTRVDIPKFPKLVWEADDRQNIDEPKERRVANAYDFISGTYSQPLFQLFDMPRNARKLAGKPKEALNVNALDEVPNSSWFTNRNFMKRVSVDEIARGPGDGEGPAEGQWTITKCKQEGISAGLQIEDAKKRAFIIKFDPEEFPELSSAADVITSRLFHAAGFNVPHNTIVVFDRDRLVPKENLVCTDRLGKKFPLQEGGLDHLLEAVAKTKDGKYRAMASRFLEGKPKGPFSYLGTRGDDDNDKFPHEHRRELRGMKVIASFTNHTDIKQLNTLDMYVEENGRKFLKHHLIDFGASLGSATDSPKTGQHGNEYLFDTGEVLKSAFTLGIYRHTGDHDIQIQHPLIGYMEIDNFDPGKWKPHYPVPPFENMTDRDAYWGAKIVASFTDEQIAAAVRAGQYSDPEAERILIDILKGRRDKVADYWFREMAPLDRFRIEGSRLVFDDLAVLAKRDTAENASYKITIRTANKKDAIQDLKHGSAATFEIGDQAVEAVITRTSKGWPAQSVAVYLQRVNGVPTIIGIRR